MPQEENLNNQICGGEILPHISKTTQYEDQKVKFKSRL